VISNSLGPALLALLTGTRVVLDYPLADNHAYLLCYWCATLALGLASNEPGRAVASGARVLIGLAFAFATLWKLALSPDFLDGTFFRVTLLTDPRFADLARIAGGLAPDALAAMREALLEHADVEVATWAALDEPASLRRLAGALTLWTAAIEAAVALGFLWAFVRGPRPVADALLVFCVTTYAVAPVAGFGWLLLAMGMAQCDASPGGARMRLAYLATYVLVLLYREIPWLEWIAGRVAPA